MIDSKTIINPITFFGIVIVVSLSIYKLPVVNDDIMAKLVGLDFEVFGVVQGVFFRKFTQKQGKELGLRGWCMNTSRGTVVGRIEGEKSKVEEMKHWLQRTGSPQSQIEKAEFRNEQDIAQFSLQDFEIKK